MAVVFDSLGYSQHLRSAGIAQDQAEAHASAVRTFIMAEIVTREDLRQALETQTLRITVRLGSLIVVATGALAALIKLGA